MTEENGEGTLAFSGTSALKGQKKGCNGSWSIEVTKFDMEYRGAGEIPEKRSAEKPRPHNGMTWSVYEPIKEISGYSHVGCHGTPKASCEPYEGDTSCEKELPILCIMKLDSIKIGQLNGSDVSAVGEIKFSQSIKGASLNSKEDADEICKNEMGTEWEMASFHENWGWDFWGKGNLPTHKRGWVYISDQKANCWDER